MGLSAAQNWRWITLVLCSYGFWKEIRPITPFLTPFLVSEAKNLTHVELYSRVFPFWTYSYLVALVPVFVLTDLLRYKPVIVSEALGLLATWLLLIWGQGVVAMQAMQICFGWATAADVAYNSYIYAAVDEAHYQKATSYLRAAVLVGRCAAFGLGQALVTSGAAGLPVLNYISLGSILLVLALSLLLPRTNDRPLKAAKINEKEGEPLKGPVAKAGASSYFGDLWAKLRRAYGDPFILKWSVWWALATCGIFQVGNYVQTLWDLWQRPGETEGLYNGAVEAASTLLCAGMTFLVQWVRVDWRVWGEAALASTSLVSAGLLLLCSESAHLAVVYAAYVVFCVLYQVTATIAAYNLGKKLEAGSYGLVFGANTFVSLLLQTLLTLAVADAVGLSLGIRSQFRVYAALHAVLALLFLPMAVVTLCSKRPPDAEEAMEPAPLAVQEETLEL